ncbi:MAG: hypothetical protein ABIF82_05680, partial [Planctomycetota bacterium]
GRRADGAIANEGADCILWLDEENAKLRAEVGRLEKELRTVRAKPAGKATPAMMQVLEGHWWRCTGCGCRGQGDYAYHRCRLAERREG